MAKKKKAVKNIKPGEFSQVAGHNSRFRVKGLGMPPKSTKDLTDDKKIPEKEPEARKKKKFGRFLMK